MKEVFSSSKSIPEEENDDDLGESVLEGEESDDDLGENLSDNFDRSRNFIL